MKRSVLLLLVAMVAAPVPAATADETSILVNPAPLAVPGTGTEGPASPYPSPITVSGLHGPVTDVDVVLHGFGHADPFEVRAVLVSPGGTATALLTANCGITPQEDLTLTLDSDASTPMTSTTSCASGTYRPDPSTSNDSLPAPAPAGPYPRTLNILDGTNPNGTWRLFLSDRRSGLTGDLEGGWTLRLRTATSEVSLPGGGTFGPGSPFGLPVGVANEPGVIADVDASLFLFWHSRPADVDLLLAGPGGQRALLMSDACGDADAEGMRFDWDDEAPVAMPDAGPCLAPRYRPTDHEPGETFPSPAPPGVAPAALSAFDGTDPNGTWRLYAVDDALGEVGFFSSASLTFTMRPRAAVAFGAPAIASTEGRSSMLTLRRTAAGNLGPAQVRVRTEAGSARAGEDFAPLDRLLTFGPGQREASVELGARADGRAEPGEAYAVAIASASGDAAAGAPARVAVSIAASSGPPPGRDTKPRCAGRRATLVGTARRDVLRGTSRRDVIVARGGNDVIRGGRGNDVICAGSGHDRASGGSGADHLIGDSGSDRLAGDSGTDRLDGGTGRDACAGGAGRDRGARCERRTRIP